MANQVQNSSIAAGQKLQQAKAVLAARGLKPQDYLFLPYTKILELAGVR